LAVLLISCVGVEDKIPEILGSGKIELPAELQIRVDQDNGFALDLLKKTMDISQKDNVLVSPISVSIALGMALNGAVGTTRTEMETALQLSGLSEENINQYYKILIQCLPRADTTTVLRLANAIWYKEGFLVKDAFLDTNVRYFNAKVKSLDFTQDWAVDTINNWCAWKTNGLIPKVIDAIPDLARMYLVNAVYFKGKWTQPFDVKDTYATTFTRESGVQGEVNMMSKLDTVPYASDDYAQYIELPYGTGVFTMTLVLPVVGKTTREVLDHLTVSGLNALSDNLQERVVDFRLPRFKVSCDYELSDQLKAMGIKQAFEDTADFSDISDDDLYISSVVHKTYAEVTEKGTEAAAVTSVEISNTSIPDYPVFIANRPFLFFIREKGTGVILFAGRMGAVEKY
jgi:serpin B